MASEETPKGRGRPKKQDGVQPVKLIEMEGAPGDSETVWIDEKGIRIQEIELDPTKPTVHLSQLRNTLLRERDGYVYKVLPEGKVRIEIPQTKWCAIQKGFRDDAIKKSKSELQYSGEDYGREMKTQSVNNSKFERFDADV